MDKYTTDTSTLIKALRVLALDIQSDDGTANATIEEASNRIEKMQELLNSVYDLVEISSLGEKIVYNQKWIKKWLKEATDCIEDKKA